MWGKAQVPPLQVPFACIIFQRPTLPSKEGCRTGVLLGTECLPSTHKALGPITTWRDPEDNVGQTTQPWKMTPQPSLGD
jgi:hypothetical protein